METSTTTNPSILKDEGNESEVVIYHGPHSRGLWRAVRSLYLFMASCAVVSPLSYFLSYRVASLEAAPYYWGLCTGTSIWTLMAIFPIIRYHQVLKMYVHKLIWQRGSDRFEVTMMPYCLPFKYHVTRTVKFADVSFLDIREMFTMFDDNGYRYFLETAHIPDKELLGNLSISQR